MVEQLSAIQEVCDKIKVVRGLESEVELHDEGVVD
jgi:hypothetical protein